MSIKASLFLFFTFLLGMLPFPASPAATVKVAVVHSQDRYPAGGRYPLALRLTIPGPWYLHGTKEENGSLIPTAITFQSGSGVRVDSPGFPAPRKIKFDYTTIPVEVFSGEVLVRTSLVIGDEAPLGEHEILGKLSYQACSETSCLPPESAPIRISLSVAPPGTPVISRNQEVFLSLAPDRQSEGVIGGFRPGGGFWLTLFGLFLGGLALNLTPCVYPLIPITVSYFGGQGRRQIWALLLHVLLYMVGLSTTNAALGVSAALSGDMLGSALQNPFVLVLVAVILVLLATSFFGYWEFRLPASLTRLASRNYGGFPGSLFMGLTLGIVAAPCIGPFVLGLLTYVGQKGDPILGFMYFFVLSLGLGLPLALLALFSGAVQKLPLSGDWMVWVRKLMGWVLVGMAAHIFGPLVPSSLGKAGILAGVSLAAAIHLGWLDRTGLTNRGFHLFKKVLAFLLVLGAGFFLFMQGYGKEGVPWMPYDGRILATAAEEKRPVILDFYADWCGPCVGMDKGVFRDPEVVRLSRHFVTLRLDLTKRLPFHQEVLARYKVKGVPTIVFLDREGRELKELRVESLVGEAEFLEKMRKGML